VNGVPRPDGTTGPGISRETAPLLSRLNTFNEDREKGRYTKNARAPDREISHLLFFLGKTAQK